MFGKTTYQRFGPCSFLGCAGRLTTAVGSCFCFCDCGGTLLVGFFFCGGTFAFFVGNSAAILLVLRFLWFKTKYRKGKKKEGSIKKSLRNIS